MPDYYDHMADSLRERRAAQRQDVVIRAKTMIEDISRIDMERETISNALDRLVFSYVVDRLSKRDMDGVKVFRNLVPAKLHKKIDDTVAMFEAIHGITPTL